VTMEYLSQDVPDVECCRLDEYRETVLLIQALGGGWDRSGVPERPECRGKLVSSNTN
jgi:hypothetical protein